MILAQSFEVSGAHLCNARVGGCVGPFCFDGHGLVYGACHHDIGLAAVADWYSKIVPERQDKDGYHSLSRSGLLRGCSHLHAR